MSKIPVLTAIRLIPRESDYLGRKSGTSGEIFFDRETNTLRLYDGNTTGGHTLRELAAQAEVVRLPLRPTIRHREYFNLEKFFPF
jgi:hypothetical protein